ncbi:MAG: hypothetical protein U0Y96_02580 [Candidatus Kapaibacterium sp.]|nr:hypothetical protein [Bacteroidota bacterium]
MKKLYQTSKWKKYSLKRQRYELRKTRIVVDKKKKRNAVLNTLESGSRQLFKRIHNTERIIPQTQFSFIKNSRGFIDFMDKVSGAFSAGKNVRIDFKNVDEITPESITVMLSRLKDANFTKGKFYSGTIPIKEEPKRILFNSSFLDYVEFNGKKEFGDGGRIIEEHKNTVASDIVKDIREFTTLKMYNDNSIKLPSIYRVYQELMKNTIEHGKGQKSTKTNRETWWTSVYYDDLNDIAYYSFVDNGVGILKSGIQQSFMDKLRIDILQLSLFGGKTRADYLHDVFVGAVKNISRTKERNRGLGLWRIYNEYKRNSIQNLIVITNDVYLNFDKKEYLVLEKEFKGTFFYWELKKCN